MTFEARLNPKKFEKEKEISPVDELLLNLETEIVSLVSSGEEMSEKDWIEIYNLFNKIEEKAESFDENETRELVDKLEDLKKLQNDKLNDALDSLERNVLIGGKESPGEIQTRSLVNRIISHYSNQNPKGAEKLTEDLKNIDIEGNEDFFREIIEMIDERVKNTPDKFASFVDDIDELKEYIKGVDKQDNFLVKYAHTVKLWGLLARKGDTSVEIEKLATELYNKFDELDEVSRHSLINFLDRAKDSEKLPIQVKERLRTYYSSLQMKI